MLFPLEQENLAASMAWKYTKAPQEREVPALPNDFRAPCGEDSEQFIPQTPADALRYVHVGAVLVADSRWPKGCTFQLPGSLALGIKRLALF